MSDMTGEVLEIKHVLYADDMVLVAETREHLKHIVREFERTCDSMGLKIDVGKSTVLTIKNDQIGNSEKVMVNGGGNERCGQYYLLGSNDKYGGWYGG